MQNQKRTTLELTKLYDDDFLQLWYDEHSRIIIKEWKQKPTEDKFRLLIMHLITKICNLRLEKKVEVSLLADCRKFSDELFSEEIICWLNEKVHKLYALNDIKKKAFVVEKANVNTSVKNYIEKSNSSIEGFEMRLFYDIDEAKQWLTNN